MGLSFRDFTSIKNLNTAFTVSQQLHRPLQNQLKIILRREMAGFKFLGDINVKLKSENYHMLKNQEKEMKCKGQTDKNFATVVIPFNMY